MSWNTSDILEYARSFPGVFQIFWNMPDILEYVRYCGHIGKHSARISGDNTQFQGMIYNMIFFRKLHDRELKLQSSQKLPLSEIETYHKSVLLFS